MSGDYSRKTFKSRNNYSGVLMQQGRVQLDADWNEQEAIGFRRQRAETVDTIGRAVVPMETPDGFRLALNAGQLSIFPGRMYVDGLLAENHGAGANEFYPVLEDERGLAPVLYQDQPFFPNANIIEGLPTSGRHIAYLDVWQRELTYVKQPELVEPAVGVDTTARWQTVWQVKVLSLDPKTSSDLECGDQNDGWDELVAPSAGRLSTSIVEPQEEDNVCLVPTEGGYRALENRLYRVEVHDGGDIDTATFKWARHNASVETSVLEINGTEIVVARSEWDGDRRFSVDDWVEVTDDVRELAGLPGEMRRVADVDYGTNTITLSGALPPADFPTQAITNATLPDRHTRLKRWEQQNLVDLDTGLLRITGAPFYLEAGIQIKFELNDAPNLSREFHSGDYWLFSARSANASIEILDRAPPRGIHHHYARLAILNFPDGLDDCRVHWPPEISGSCCSVTVGDGKTSHGQFTSIQEAVKQLPENGGKVCVLPGRYQENVNILGKRNVTISGCGDRSIVTSNEDSDSASAPIFRIVSGDGIRIESLSIETNSEGEGEGVLIDGKEPSKNISLNELSITAGLGCGIRCNSGVQIVITNNHIRMRDEFSEWPGIFVIADDVQILTNHVEAQQSTSLAPGEDDVGGRLLLNASRGGIQIGGTSERVKIADNTIQRGRGDGITLGSLSLVDDKGIVLKRVMAMIRVTDDDCEPCSPPDITIPPQVVVDDDGKPRTVVSAGDLYDIVIEGNNIEDMGRNGIGVVGFFDLDQSDSFISVENLEISNNLIQGCLSSQLRAVDSELEGDIGYGGIALSDTMNLLIHHNQILDNGLRDIDPICGIYVLHGEGVEICDNRILHNGVKFKGDKSEARRGARSGIHLVYAVAPTVQIFPDSKASGFPRQNGVPAAKIHNNIVSHPAGRALTVNALGPVSVSDNQLTSRGISPGSASALASVVAIINLGVSNEFYQQISSFRQMAKGNLNLSTLTAGVDTRSSNLMGLAGAEQQGFRLGQFLANGNVMFVNNQVVLDELDAIENVALSAVAIFSLDDINFNGNQIDCSLWKDFLVFPTFLFALSVRVSDNRFKEGFVSALLSALTVGLMNTTTDNQSTHCMIAIGSGKRIFEDNIELWDVVMGKDDACSSIRESIGKVINLGRGN